MTKKFEFILFDLDRTLWDFDTNARNNISRLLAKYNLNVGDYSLFYNEYDKINHTLWSAYEKGEISKEELRGQRFYKTFLKYDIDNIELSELFGIEYLDTMPDQTALMPFAYEVLSKLHEKGIKMAIISNGFKEVQYRKLNSSGIGKFFDAVIISEEVGFHKPSPLIFKKAIELLNADKSKTLMVGDDIANDIEGAQVFGISQYFYNYKEIKCESAPTYESNSLNGILDLLE